MLDIDIIDSRYPDQTKFSGDGVNYDRYLYGTPEHIACLYCNGDATRVWENHIGHMQFETFNMRMHIAYRCNRCKAISVNFFMPPSWE